MTFARPRDDAPARHVALAKKRKITLQKLGHPTGCQHLDQIVEDIQQSIRGWLRWGPLLVVWAGAIAGISLKTIFLDACPDWLGLSLYLALDWSGLFGAILLARKYGLASIKPVLFGGLAYSIGGVMELRGWPVVIPGWIHPHEVFHIAVLFGALFHWRFIWTIARGDIFGQGSRSGNSLE